MNRIPGRLAAGVSLILCCMLLDSCLFSRRPKFNPPPAAVIEPPRHQPAPDLTPPPALSADAQSLPAAPEIPIAPPDAPVPPKPHRARVTKPAPSESVGPVAPATPPPADVPQLEPLMSDVQQRAYNMAIDNLVARARRNIQYARRHSLNARQRERVAQAATFMLQAVEARKQDLTAAKSLAERAELLSREVLSELQ
jgi:hypothetical protein